jgi:hypothetical protein
LIRFAAVSRLAGYATKQARSGRTRRAEVSDSRTLCTGQKCARCGVLERPDVQQPAGQGLVLKRGLRDRPQRSRHDGLVRAALARKNKKHKSSIRNVMARPDALFGVAMVSSTVIALLPPGRANRGGSATVPFRSDAIRRTEQPRLTGHCDVGSR